jgi:hypothetical protein
MQFGTAQEGLDVTIEQTAAGYFDLVTTSTSFGNSIFHRTCRRIQFNDLMVAMQAATEAKSRYLLRRSVDWAA